jgi:hypothetical protein
LAGGIAVLRAYYAGEDLACPQYGASQFHRERGILTQLPPSWSEYHIIGLYHFDKQKKKFLKKLFSIVKEKFT